MFILIRRYSCIDSNKAEGMPAQAMPETERAVDSSRH